PQAIPDGGTLNVPLLVNDSLQVNDLSVGVSITHAQASELSLTLIAPDGTQVPLFLAGGTGANLVSTIFDANSPISIAAGSWPSTGLFRPRAGIGTAAVSSGGSGYSVNDILTVQGGVFSTPAQLKVTAVGAGGAITAVSIVQPGLYNTQ